MKTHGIKSAILGAATALMMLSTPVMAEPLTGAQLQTMVIGQTLEARRLGQTLTMQFNIDGTVTVASPILNGTGSWTLQGDTICTTGLRGNGTRCMSFELIDATTLRSSEGMTLRIVS